MILYLPTLLLIAGLALAHRRAGAERLVGVLALVGAGAGCLALVVGPSVGIGWAIGPTAGILIGKSTGTRPRLAFEGLMRRSVTLVMALLAGAIIASKLPVGENPWLLTGVLWFAGAVGLGWRLVPRDDEDLACGGVLALAGFTGVLVLAILPGPLTATLAGATAVVPAVMSRWRGFRRDRPAIRVSLLVPAAAVALVAVLTTTPFGAAVFDVRLSVAGVALPALVVVLLAAGFQGERYAWLAPVAALSVVAVSPVLRWAALAGVVAGVPIPDRRSQRLAWAGVVLLFLNPVVQVLAAAPFGLRLASVTLAVGLVLLVLASLAPAVRALVLPAAGVQVLGAVQQLAPGSVTRFQWAAAAGAVLLVAYPLMADSGAREGRARTVRTALTASLLLIAVAARDPLDLGSLATFLLLIDLAIVAPARAEGPLGRLAHSGWPPAVAFAGRVLAVAAAVQASVLFGVLAVALVAGLYLSTIAGGARRAAARPQPSINDRLVAGLSLGIGVAPVILLRMLHT